MFKVISNEKKEIFTAILVLAVLVGGYFWVKNYQAKLSSAEKTVALKLLPNEYVLDPEAKLLVADAQGSGKNLAISKLFSSQLTADHLAARYRGYFPAKGWLMTTDRQPDKAHYFLVFYKGGPQLMVNIAQDSKDTTHSQLLLEYYPNQTAPTLAPSQPHPVLDKYLKLLKINYSPSPTPVAK